MEDHFMKTILILADGMRPDSLTNIAAAQRIIARGKSTMAATTVMPSITLPCHLSLFHSVDPSRHGTTTNTYMPQVRPIVGLCETLKQFGKTSAFFYGWNELRDLVRPSILSYSCFIRGAEFTYLKADEYLTDEAIRFLKANPVDFTFLYLGHPDSAGHRYGWMSEEYMESVKTSWDNIEKITSAFSDEYNFIITADHGGHARTHGTSIPEDMTIPMIFLGKVAEQVTDLENASIKDIAPTVTALLGVSADPKWEGKSLIS
jgi:predicted AlkP superfamily pyrophosphatase or phosphodiesterase